MAISADQLKAIQYAIGPQWYQGGEAGGNWTTPTAAFNLDGYNYAPAGDGSFWRFKYDPSIGSNATGYNGRQYEAFDANGNKVGDGTLNGYGEESFMSKWGPFLMTAAGFAPAVLGAGAAGAGGTVGGLDSAGGILNNAVMSGGAGGAEAGWGLTNAVVNGANTADLAGMTAAGTGATVLPEAAAGGGLLSTIGGAAKSLVNAVPGGLGTLGALAGALAGAQGVKNTQSSTQKTDPRVDPYLFGGNGNPGLLNMTQQQLMNSLSPSTLAGWESLKQKGLGLMNQPVAQNGFGLLTKGRY